MASILANTSGPLSLYDALKAEGFDLPENCGDVSMELPVDGAIRLKYDVVLDPDQLEKLGRALARIGKENR